MAGPVHSYNLVFTYPCQLGEGEGEGRTPAIQAGQTYRKGKMSLILTFSPREKGLSTLFIPTTFSHTRLNGWTSIARTTRHARVTVTVISLAMFPERLPVSQSFMQPAGSGCGSALVVWSMKCNSGLTLWTTGQRCAGARGDPMGRPDSGNVVALFNLAAEHGRFRRDPD